MRAWMLFLGLICCCLFYENTAEIVENECKRSLTRSKTVGDVICKGALIFEDNFDSLDYSKWAHEVTMAGGGNGEFQVYWWEPENSFTQNGHLMLNPGFLADIYGEDFLTSGTLDLTENCTASWNDGCVRTGNNVQILPPATSARVHTVDKFSFLYGQVEVRAKVPAGDWLWPAIWMMPQDSVYGGWPTSGEIDIMESRGNRDLGSFDGGLNIGVEQAGSTMHWGPDPGHNAFMKTHWERNTAPGNGFNNDFHLYQLEWTPDYIKFSLDNVEMGTITPPAGGFYELGEFANQGLPNPWTSGTFMAPFDQEFFLIINLAVGGTGGYFPDGVSNPGGKPWRNNSPKAAKDFWDGRSQWESTWLKDGSDNLQVDYVRVWAL